MGLQKPSNSFSLSKVKDLIQLEVVDNVSNMIDKLSSKKDKRDATLDIKLKNIVTGIEEQGKRVENTDTRLDSIVSNIEALSKNSVEYDKNLNKIVQSLNNKELSNKEFSKKFEVIDRNIDIIYNKLSKIDTSIKKPNVFMRSVNWVKRKLWT